MIQATRRWFRRNRTNFAIGAGVLGAGYLAGQYVLSKLGEARQRMGDERTAKENLRRRFEQNQEDCTFTVLAILPTASENILEALPVEQTLGELQQQKAARLARSVGASDAASSEFPSAPASVTDEDGRSLASFQSEGYVHASQVAESTGGSGEGSLQVPQRPQKSKAQLWNEMKISSIARAFTLIYTLALLTLLTRVQLNLLGRRNYLASVVSLASPPQETSRISLENNDDDNYENAYGNDFETNRKYLSFSWWLLHKGCKDVMERVMAAVKEVFGPVNPREDVTLERLSELVLEARKKVEGATEEERRTHKWLAYLLPPRDREDHVLRESGMIDSADTSPPTPPALRRLLDETSDLIDSPAFTHVLTLLLDAAFSLLIDTKVATFAYKMPPTSASTARVQEIVGADAKAKVASTLPVFCRQAHSIGSGAANEYLAAMEGVRDLQAFAAVVYSSNFEFEAAEPGSVGAEPREPDRPDTLDGDAAAGAGAERAAAALQGTGLAAASETEEAPEPGQTGPGGDASLVGAESGLETAWGKALAKEDGRTLVPAVYPKDNPALDVAAGGFPFAQADARHGSRQGLGRTCWSWHERSRCSSRDACATAPSLPPEHVHACSRARCTSSPGVAASCAPRKQSRRAARSLPHRRTASCPPRHHISLHRPQDVHPCSKRDVARGGPDDAKTPIHRPEKENGRTLAPAKPLAPLPRWLSTAPPPHPIALPPPSPNPTATMAAGDTPNYAYVTLITRSSYLAGVVVLAHTLRAHGSSYPLVVLYTASLPASSVRALEAEAPRTNLVLQPCEPLLPRSDTPVHLIAERFADTWTKLRVFSLLRYDTLCYLDADMAVFNGSMDAIFAVAEAALPRGRADGEDRIAANHACVCNLDGDAWAPPDWTPANCAYTPLRHPRALAQPTPAGGPVPAHHLLNSGMFVFRPRAALWARMLRFFDTTDRLGGYKFPDQDFLADFFRGRWVSVGWQFNALKTMRYWHPAMWRDDAVVCLHYIVDKPWARRVGDDGVAGYLGRDGETHRWWWACFAEWERQREGLEVLELVRRCVARPPGEEGDEDADMKAIGSQVQAFAKNKPNGKESESNGAANGVANGAARENGAAKENGAVKENGAARENGDREQSDRQVNGEAPAQGPHGPILRKKMLGERGHGPVVHDTPNGS